MPVPQTKVYLGSALSTAQALRFLPNAGGDFSITVSASPAAKWLGSAGDLDGDGLPDFVFGAPGDDDKAVDAGRVFVHLGAPSPGATLTVADSASNIIIDGVNAGDRAGAAVGAIGDLNGDGARGKFSSVRRAWRTVRRWMRVPPSSSGAGRPPAASISAIRSRPTAVAL
jgi:hypothetical protein